MPDLLEHFRVWCGDAVCGEAEARWYAQQIAIVEKQKSEAAA